MYILNHIYSLGYLTTMKIKSYFFCNSNTIFVIVILFCFRLQQQGQLSAADRLKLQSDPSLSRDDIRSSSSADAGVCQMDSDDDDDLFCDDSRSDTSTPSTSAEHQDIEPHASWSANQKTVYTQSWLSTSVEDITQVSSALHVISRDQCH